MGEIERLLARLFLEQARWRRRNTGGIKRETKGEEGLMT